jgi:hypothetical protein
LRDEDPEMVPTRAAGAPLNLVVAGPYMNVEDVVVWTSPSSVWGHQANPFDGVRDPLTASIADEDREPASEADAVSASG